MPSDHFLYLEKQFKILFLTSKNIYLRWLSKPLCILEGSTNFILKQIIFISSEEESLGAIWSSRNHHQRNKENLLCDTGGQKAGFAGQATFWLANRSSEACLNWGSSNKNTRPSVASMLRTSCSSTHMSKPPCTRSIHRLRNFCGSPSLKNGAGFSKK